MLITTESFNAGLAELDEELKNRSDDLLSGKVQEGNYKSAVAYIQGILFAKNRMTDSSDRVSGRKKSKPQLDEDEDGDGN